MFEKSNKTVSCECAMAISEYAYALWGFSFALTEHERKKEKIESAAEYMIKNAEDFMGRSCNTGDYDTRTMGRKIKMSSIIRQIKSLKEQGQISEISEREVEEIIDGLADGLPMGIDIKCKMYKQ